MAKNDLKIDLKKKIRAVEKFLDFLSKTKVFTLVRVYTSSLKITRKLRKNLHSIKDTKNWKIVVSLQLFMGIQNNKTAVVLRQNFCWKLQSMHQP